jgi:peptide chain release factor 2
MNCGGIFDYENQVKRLRSLEDIMAQPGFWDQGEKSKAVIEELKILKAKLEPVEGLEKKYHDFHALVELVKGDDSPDTHELVKELDQELKVLESQLADLELRNILGGPYDKNNAIMMIHSGAGGTESCDWVEMLLRMYRRWIERHRFKDEVAEIMVGEEAGIKSVTLLIQGEYAYGFLKAEKGVHRLVRISPFDSNKRRHTSFASVDVIPEVNEDIPVEIEDKDLRVDTFRASGAGGQHVNKTDSAVRLTHIPTGIVVACQNERSQHKNRATAMKILKARVYALKLKEQEEKMAKVYGQKSDIAWGSQIRSYVFHPYTMVKDHRTDTETSNGSAVMDGDIDDFIQAYLRQ